VKAIVARDSKGLGKIYRSACKVWKEATLSAFDEEEEEEAAGKS
jgi:hypothetical protein